MHLKMFIFNMTYVPCYTHINPLPTPRVVISCDGFKSGCDQNHSVISTGYMVGVGKSVR